MMDCVLCVEVLLWVVVYAKLNIEICDGGPCVVLKSAK
jgi:hypothetical protein